VNQTTSGKDLLNGRRALVTGASSGLGERFARVLRSEGAEVLVTARRSERLEVLANEIDASSLPGDITSPAHREALTGAVREKLGGLDILLNNAGICDDGPLEAQSLADIESIVQLNLVAVMDTCRLMAPLLFASGCASIINIASIYGLVGARTMAGYAATKGAIVNLTRHLAAEWGDRNVRVNALAPGYFPSEMTGMLEDKEFARSVAERTLLGRIPKIEELDGPLLFLASDASSYVTGHTLVVDGGWTSV
jgi:NAD(P)-dependent dehydrogenase (short-subunit alcohol dehydrogenase family)